MSGTTSPSITLRDYGDARTVVQTLRASAHMFDLRALNPTVPAADRIRLLAGRNACFRIAGDVNRQLPPHEQA